MLTINGFEKAFEYWQLFLQGVVCTISLSALTVLFGFILALVLAACRMGKSRILRAVSTAYVELFRATPMVVQVFLIYYVVFNGVKVLPGVKLFGFIRGCFAHRRKSLWNNLQGVIGKQPATKDKMAAVLDELGISPHIRPLMWSAHIRMADREPL